ncbi:hypothetical protein CL629_03665 [bacterium]|nr:hypothetical protein [bacterium]|tara:strand:- start:12579 stop:13577 length:999 start_codon:yes stop_codon:yes gene_type:complete
MKNKTHTTPRDFFLHLLHIITLYGSAIALISILWQVINIGFPDAAEGGYRFYGINSAVRWSIAVLIVMFPVLLGTGRFLERAYNREPEKKELKIRKWLVYFTLFATAIIIIIDLVRLIFEFLGGELTPRFILKFLSVLVIAAAIFWYYLQSVKKTPWSYKILGLPAKKIFVWKTIVFVLAVIIVGFVLIDSPADERAYKNDDRRMQDLQIIQSRIVENWRQGAPTSTLPSSLDELGIEARENGYDPLRDPVTEETYGYRITGEMSFELCAAFEKETRGKEFIEPYVYLERKPIPVRTLEDAGEREQYYIESNSWTHEEGEACFERTIVKEKI